MNDWQHHRFRLKMKWQTVYWMRRYRAVPMIYWSEAELRALWGDR